MLYLSSVLIAEIHGKSLPEVRGSEDYLTSAVFGHLRHVVSSDFWNSAFSRARTVEANRTSLLEELKREGIHLEGACDLKVRFWPSTAFGEPDLLLRFGNPKGRSILILIEVKLFSPKSGTGENDQLSRYFDFLQDEKGKDPWLRDNPFRVLIYLTERYSADELRASLAVSKQEMASKRMFLMQWQELLDSVKECHPERDSLLDEVARFLDKRNLGRFSGFHEGVSDFYQLSGHFYSSSYYQLIDIPAMSTDGRYYVDGTW